MATATTAAEPETKTYWCHECDMSVALTSPSPSPSPLLCPHCHTHFLELMDSTPSPFPQFHADPFPSSLSLFDSPFLHRLLHHHLIATDTDPNTLRHEHQQDLQLDDPFALLSSPTSKPCWSDSIPTIAVTSSLLLQLDPGGGLVLCAVCKDPIGVDAQAKHLPCNHLYHSDCITPWLEHHTSCPLCRFQLSAADDDGDGDDGASLARGVRRQLRAAMMRLSELMEEEEDFYGLRTTLHHIAIRHGLLSSDNEENPSVSVLLPTQMDEAENLSVAAVGGNGDLESLSSFPVERGVFGSAVGGDGQSGVTG